MATVYVSAGFTWPDGNCVASATVSWDDDFYVTVSNVKFSYTSGGYISAPCKWRIRPRSGGSELAGTDSSNSFQATEGTTYVFQACVSGPYPWGNSNIEEGEEGSSYFTVKANSGGGGGDFPDTPEIYAIIYNANGGTGAPSTHFKTEGEIVYLSYIEPIKADVYEDPYVVTLHANGGECSVGSLQADRITYFIFGYWNTKPDGSGITYHPGGSYSYDAPLTLYAIYLEDTVTKSVELPTPTRDGYEFLGWSTDQSAASGITGIYEPGENIKFYAIWKANGLLYIYDGAKFSAYQVYIYDGISWNLYCPYVYDSGWSLCS